VYIYSKMVTKLVQAEWRTKYACLFFIASTLWKRHIDWLL